MRLAGGARNGCAGRCRARGQLCGTCNSSGGEQAGSGAAGPAGEVRPVLLFWRLPVVHEGKGVGSKRIMWRTGGGGLIEAAGPARANPALTGRRHRPANLPFWQETSARPTPNPTNRQSAAASSRARLKTQAMRCVLTPAIGRRHRRRQAILTTLAADWAAPNLNPASHPQPQGDVPARGCRRWLAQVLGGRLPTPGLAAHPPRRASHLPSASQSIGLLTVKQEAAAEQWRRAGSGGKEGRRGFLVRTQSDGGMQTETEAGRAGGRGTVGR